MVKVRIFFLPSRVFQEYDCYFTNVLTQRSCFEVLLTADSQCFTRDDARIFVPTTPRLRLALTVSWKSEVFVHCEQCGQFFLTRRPRHQFPLPANLHRHSVALAFNKTKPALSSIDVVSKAFKRTARTSLCGIWEHPQRCFLPFGQKPREA